MTPRLPLSFSLGCGLVALMCAAAPARALVLGVTEGVTYQATDNQIQDKFQPIADVLSKSLKEPVTIKVLSNYNAARSALKAQEIDLAFVHPAHVALQATMTGSYSDIAWTAGYTEYKVSLLCDASDSLTDWKGLSGKKLVTPDPDSITAVVTRAMLREHQVKSGAVAVNTTKYQEAVPFYVKNHFADYGATASTAVVKEWQTGGGKVCAESRAVPIKQWLASNKLSPGQLAAARETLMDLNVSDAGKKALATSGYSGFVAPAPNADKTLSAWLGIGAP